MVKAIKVMLIPNNIQKTKMFQYAGASRFAYNWALAREIENYEKGGKFISDAELRKEFTKLRHSDEYAWLLGISNNVTKQAIKDACTAYKNFFKGLQKFPRFKSKRDQCRSSIRIILRYNSAILMLSLKDFLRAGKEINKN
ncbi:helix-turn-helix domain-containing protein [Blautia massiliensis (ex Durand et al. 2017)]|uniref:helix-turn-helix domain-containing protein n=1 Tax=Blautia massiliensis (ex Durand et al. 2017) TaxID=1737424 RepID=UPI0039926D58